MAMAVAVALAVALAVAMAMALAVALAVAMAMAMAMAMALAMAMAMAMAMALAMSNLLGYRIIYSEDFKMGNNYYGWVPLQQAIDEKWDDDTTCWYEWSPGVIAVSSLELYVIKKIVSDDPTWHGGPGMVICHAMKPLPRSV